MKRIHTAVLVATAFVAFQPSSYAIIPVLVDFDATATINQIETMAEWASQLEKMAAQIQQVNTMINQGKQMAAIVGDPKLALPSISQVKALVDNFGQNYANQNGSLIDGSLSVSANLGSIGGVTMTIGGTAVQRNTSQYEGFRVANANAKNLLGLLDKNNSAQQQLANQRQSLMTEFQARQASGSLTQSDVQRYQLSMSALQQQELALDQLDSAAVARVQAADAQRVRDQQMQTQAEEEKTQAEAEKFQGVVETTEASTDAATFAAATASNSKSWENNTVDKKVFGGL